LYLEHHLFSSFKGQFCSFATISGATSHVTEIFRKWKKLSVVICGLITPKEKRRGAVSFLAKYVVVP